MDFLFSTAFVKYEVAFLALNFLYILFHIAHSIVHTFIRIKNFVHPERPATISEQAIEAATATNTEISEAAAQAVVEEKKTEEVAELTPEEKHSISELVKNIKTKIARGEYTEARARIIEGLSIDKFNKDINCLLASLYEKDKDYKKAEFIYKDLILINDTDPELYLKLGFVLSIQGKYEIAYEIYKRLLSLDESNMEAVEMLANLGHQLTHYNESIDYVRMYLKKHPRNIDMLYLLAVNHINLEQRNEALEPLKKIREMEPYNVKINDLMDKLRLELELEKNFKSEQDQ